MKPTIYASLALAILSAAELSGCGQENTNATTGATAAPVSEVDLRINDYEKAANEYGRVAKRLKAGDVSLTVRYIELEKRTREAAARLQPDSAKMTPPQAQRVADILVRTAPYLQP